jgi:hypothetical protein
MKSFHVARAMIFGAWVCWLSGLQVAHAGNDTGNGGNSIVCLDAQGKIRSAELLDLYEARVMRGIVPNLGSLSVSYPEKVEMALKRLERLSPLRAAKYRGWIADFERDSLFLPGVTLVEVPDSDHIVVPDGCKRMQLIVQKAPSFPEDKRFTISKDIWDYLDNDNRAAAVLHEAIYREGFEENHHANSVASRYFNSIIVSERISAMTLEAFAKVLVSLPMTDLGLPGYGVDGVLKPVVGRFWGVTDSEGSLLHPRFKELPITYYPGGSAARTAWLSGAQESVNLGSGPSSNRYALRFSGEKLVQAGFFAEGALQEIYLRHEGFYSWREPATSVRFVEGDSLVIFDAQGFLASIRAYRPRETGRVTLKSGRQATLEYTEDGSPGTLYFNPDGSYARSTGKVSWWP